VPYQVFETADEPIVVAVGNDRQFAKLCAVIGCGHLADDVRYATNAERVKNRHELVALIAQPLHKNTADHWLGLLEQQGVPVGPVNSVGEAFSDPHVVARSTVVQLQRDDLGQVPGVRSPLRFQNCSVDAERAPPALGDSTAAVLREIGISDTDMEALVEAGVVGKFEGV